MKKSLFLICATLFANMLLAQSQFTIDYLTYKVLNEDEVEVIDCVDSIGVVEIPATTQFLGSLSFDNCDSLSEFTTLSTTPPTLDLNVFGVLEYSSGLLPDNALLKVPCGTLSAYSSSDWSSYFSDITEMCDGVSLEEVKDFEIYFYPNPTIGNITFEKTIEKIEVISQIGKILLTFNNTSAINISDLPKGVYYLRLYTNNQPILQKIIKQ